LDTEDNNISAVVINYNGKEHLERCLTALTQEAGLQEIMVVDDASTDGSVELVQERFPQVMLLQQAQNLGPVTARQTGFRRARGKYILFVDCDAIVLPGAIAALRQFLDHHPQVWLAGCRMVDTDGRVVLWNYGPFPSIHSSALVWLRYLSFRLPVDKTMEVDWVAEACFMVRHEVMTAIDGFDTNIFMFHEGPDLAMRAKAKGYATAIVHTAQVVCTNQKVRLRSQARLMVFYQSTLYLYRKHYHYCSYLFMKCALSVYVALRRLGLAPPLYFE